MLDIQYIRDHPEEVDRAIKNKKVSIRVDEVLAADRLRVELQQEVEQAQAEKNRLNDRIASVSGREREALIEEGKKIKERLDELKPKYTEADETYRKILLQIPNIPSEDTPIGGDEGGNRVIRQVGEKPAFDFSPKEHWEIGEVLGVIDSDRAAKVSGSRFHYLKGDLVLLEFAMMQFAFSVLTNEKIIGEIIRECNLSVSAKPFVPVFPPVMMRPDMMIRMARLDPEQMYQIKEDDLVLVGSAEHTLGSMFADEILEERDLPIRLAGFSSAFRREAGTYGKDMKGMLRVHQFNKLEMETFSTAESSLEEQNLNVALQEYLLKQLGIPYQVVLVCTGDMGKPDVRQIDIEAWMPGQNRYRETNTSDLIGDFQSRRLNTRIRRNDGSLELAHMNDATAFSERPLIAIMENFQEKDGSVVIPSVLRQWVGKEKITAML